MRSANSDIIQRTMHAVQTSPARELPIRGAQEPVPAPRNDDIDRYYWRGPGVDPPPREGGYQPVDDQLFRIPSGQEVDGDDAQIPFWATGNCPPWNCPTYWSIPFTETFEICIPTYEQEYNIGIINTGDMEMSVIKSVSYHVTSGLGQYELFEFKFYRNLQFRTKWEDMLIDPTTADPSQRYVFAGDTRPLLLEERIDRARMGRFTVKARGIVDLAGNSNHAPGDPLSPSANFRLVVNGWIAPLRRNVDGAPRPTDLGNMGFIDLDPDLKFEGI